LWDYWVGALIDYDRNHRSEFAEDSLCISNDFQRSATAAKLHVHRNSVRYRLARITELTGWVLNDPNSDSISISPVEPGCATAL